MTNINENRDWSQYASLEEMSEWAKQRKFANLREYMSKDIKKPANFFFNPQSMPGFKDMGGWGGFLGTGRRRYKEAWASIEESAEYIRSINDEFGEKIISNMQEWTRFSQKEENNVPLKYPRRFDMHYKAEYKEKGPFEKLIGKPQLWAYENAKAYVQQMNFESVKDFFLWRETQNKPRMFPKNPERAYKDKGFISMRDFLGLGSGDENELSVETKAPAKKEKKQSKASAKKKETKRKASPIDTTISGVSDVLSDFKKGKATGAKTVLLLRKLGALGEMDFKEAVKLIGDSLDDV